MIYLFCFLQGIFNFIVFLEELLQLKCLPLVGAPIFIHRSDLPPCHDKQSEVGDLLNHFVGEFINLAV